MNFKRSALSSAVLIGIIALAGCNNDDDDDYVVVPPPVEDVTSLVQYVDPLIGTGGLGNTYPGATVPHGMIQLSPNNGTGGWDYIGGYAYKDDQLVGFSHKQLSGTGAGDLNDILVMPINSRSNHKRGSIREATYFSHQREDAQAGYYSVMLDNYGIKAELTTTDRVGIHRYTLPKDGKTQIVFNIANTLNWDAPTAAQIRVVDEYTVEGYRHSDGWAKQQREHFVMKFSQPIVSHIIKNDSDKVDVQDEAEAKLLRAYFQFDTSIETTELVVKVALSSVDIEGAYKNLAAEAQGWNFDEYRVAAQDRWQDYLEKIKIEADETQKRIFYTSMYHNAVGVLVHSDVDGRYNQVAHGNAQIATTDKNGDGNPDFTRYDTFSLWDTYRAAHPLYTIIEPERVNDMVKSMMAHYDATDMLPVWSMQGSETDMMFGYHAVPVMVDAYLKGLTDADPELMLQAMKDTANNGHPKIAKYRELGYVPFNPDILGDDTDGDGNRSRVQSRQGGDHWDNSRSLEYSYDDWAIAQMAKALGKTTDVDHFRSQAKNWTKQYDPATKWMSPRLENGSFYQNFDVFHYDTGFSESNAWQYMFHVQHDMESLVSRMGHVDFIQRLDDLFQTPLTAEQTDPDSTHKLPIFSTGMVGQYVQGNEPGHHVPYLYNYAGEPWKTQKWVKAATDVCYTDLPSGICGNDDYGQMSAWYVFSSLGFYPVNPAEQRYVIGTPMVEKAEIAVNDGETFTVKANNVSDTNFYIQSATLNSQPFNRTYITHNEIMDGGELVFEMGAEPNYSWGVDTDSVPPSFTTEALEPVVQK